MARHSAWDSIRMQHSASGPVAFPISTFLHCIDEDTDCIKVGCGSSKVKTGQNEDWDENMMTSDCSGTTGVVTEA